jgi:glutathione S-transferase
LELDDSSYIVESLPIVDYLEDKFPDNTLYTGTPEQRAKARDLERIVDLRIGGPMGAYGHATKSPLGRPPEPEKAAQYLQAMQTPMDYLERLLSDGRPLLGGEHVNVADCTMQSSLHFMRFI